MAHRPSPRGMIGHQRELDTLTQTWQTTSDGTSSVTLLAGEAGIGKSTLVQALAELVRSAGEQVVISQCIPLGTEGLSYAPIGQLLQQLSARHGVESLRSWAGAGWPTVAPLLPGIESDAVVSDESRLQLFEAITRILEHAATTAPLLVVIEDLHWVDSSTLGTLRFLVRALSQVPVMLVATFRSDELERRHPIRPFLAELARLHQVTRLEVSRLDDADVARLIASVAESAPAPGLVRLISRHAQGIPYFVIELARSTSSATCLRLPQTLQDALRERIAGLSEPTLETLRAMSVAGNRIDDAVLRQLAAQLALTDLDHCLREAVDGSVIDHDDTGYSFRHALLREVIHDELLPGEHTRLHAALAGVLSEHTEHANRSAAAHHWFAAHDLARGFHTAITVAADPRTTHAEALSLYTKALQVWDQVPDAETVAAQALRHEHQASGTVDDLDVGDLPTKVLVLQRASARARNAGEDHRGADLIDAALALTDPTIQPLAVSRLLISKARLLFVHPDSQVRPIVQQAVDLTAPFGDTPERAFALNQLAIHDLINRHATDALSTSQELVQLCRRLGLPGLEGSGLITMGSAMRKRLGEAEGLRVMESARELARVELRYGLRFAINLSDALHAAGRYPDAVREARGGMEIVRRLGLERSMGQMLVGNLADPLVMLGEWEEAEGLVDRGLALDPPQQHRLQLTLIKAELLVWRDHLDEAEDLFTACRATMDPRGTDIQLMAPLAAGEAELFLATGQPERAWAAVVSELDRPHTPPDAVFSLLIPGGFAAHDGAAVERIQQELTALAGIESGRAATHLPVIRAAIGEDPGWAQAFAERDQLPPLFAARVAFRRGLATKDDAVLQEADDRAAVLGAQLLRRQIRQARGHRAPTTRTGPQGLTEREREVLALVAAGRSNGQIGSELFISTKTASVHVSHIIAKLGVANRVEAAARAHADGLI